MTTAPAPRARRWVGPALFALSALVVALLALLAVSIMERRWEAMRPAIALKPIADWEPDNAVWGENYPREYDSYRRTATDTTRTLHGGAEPRDYLAESPQLVILFAGYGFAKEYRQARGHYHAVTDVTRTKRLATPFQAGTCWTCKTTHAPKLMAEMGVEQFYAANFHDLAPGIKHPIGCQDCHDPKTMRLRITRPALREAFKAMGRNIDEATHQEMRSLVCAQCHVEYYFKKDPKNYLVFPWAKGTGVEAMLDYYDAMDFTDWVHPVSKAPMLKVQHPDWEVYTTGIHAYRNVSCADCHMPYRTEGGMKYTDHHIQSPLLNIANSCAVCHRWGEGELRSRVEAIQSKVLALRQTAEQALVRAHLDIAAAAGASIADPDLAPARKLLRHAQFRWDFVAANNGLGFHSPQECMRVLGDAVNQAQEVRLLVARLLAAKGQALPATYPDISTREKAQALVEAFLPKP
ncbi:MAG: ammonia-forming cytochrome c nitrite reductase subunit c552 [Planctomycetes bacterium]|nr:ammonia-forming cytochrome c nitrite reductase subunit c552 [Planctomycetota bacterium]